MTSTEIAGVSLRDGALIGLIAGFGGTLPTLSRLAAQYVNAPMSPLPPPGMLVGLLLFFVIGCVLALAFGEKSLRQALVIGISAPAIITSISVGAGDANKPLEPKNTSGNPQPIVDPRTLKPFGSIFLPKRFISHAYAENILTIDKNPVLSTNDRSFFLDRSAIFGARNIDLQITVTGDLALTGALSVTLQFFDEGGYKISAASAVVTLANKENVSLRAPDTARGFLIESGNQKVSRTFPGDVAFNKLVYSVDFAISRASGFGWAIGYERSSATVDKIDIRLTETDKFAPVDTTVGALREKYVFGIDASHFQDKIAWDALDKIGIRFAFLRATYGDTKDTKLDDFREAYFNSSQTIAIGYYHFFRFKVDVDKQVAAFLEAIDGRKPEKRLPDAVVIGLNRYDPRVSSDSDRQEYLKEVQNFMDGVEQHTGTKLLVMVGEGAADRFPIKEITDGHQIWIEDLSNPAPLLPVGINNFQFWQFGTGDLNGIPGPVALDVFNGTLADFKSYLRKKN